MRYCIMRYLYFNRSAQGYGEYNLGTTVQDRIHCDMLVSYPVLW